ncbi:MAG: hypothetical protein AAF965_07420 [Pseudomonadota bacterium]
MTPWRWTSNLCACLGAAVLLAVSSLTPSPSYAQNVNASCGENLPLSGTLTFDGASVAMIVGLRWGQGVLTLNNGTEVPFSARGVKPLESGMQVGTVTGEVYGLSQIQDFVGQYRGVGQAVVPVQSEGDLILLNPTTCVAIVARSASTGFRFSAPNAQSIQVQFR